MSSPDSSISLGIQEFRQESYQIRRLNNKPKTKCQCAFQKSNSLLQCGEQFFYSSSQMRPLALLIYCFLCTGSGSAVFADIDDNMSTTTQSQKCVRGCARWGFFAEFLWTLNHLHWCESTGQIPVVYWDQQCAYYSPDGYNGSTNAWEYYFEPVSDLTYTSGDPIHREEVYTSFSTIWWYKQYIDNLYLLTDEEQSEIKPLPLPMQLTGGNYPTPEHLYSRKFRMQVNKLLDKYVKVKPSIQEKIDIFYDEQMRDRRVIGLHCRGRFLYNEVGDVPIEWLCEEANRYADGNTIFFVATDQTPLLEQAKKLLRGIVIYYDCYRQETTTSPFSSQQLHPQMGEDVLVEVLLLARCDHLIHTISNVSTTVLYFNPTQPHTLLYGNQTPK